MDPSVTDVYAQLAARLSMTGMPMTDALTDLLRHTFTPEEAQVAVHLEPASVPLATQTADSIAAASGLTSRQVETVLEQLVSRNLVFCRRPENRSKEYGFHHAGFGFPQSFFWNNDQSGTAQQMSRLVIKYFNRDTTRKAFGGTPTKPYRYVPVHQSVTPQRQSVLPHDRMADIIDSARQIAVAHCPCRVQAQLWGRGCEHSLEVCLKFDELADYLIERKLGRQISKEEAKKIIDDAAAEGLVHFVDNTASKVKHNCNCCGCACWNVGLIKRRKIPRDELMAVYYIRQMDPDNCAGCENCLEICPVDAVSMQDGVAVVDAGWCIGCGVCATRCDFDAVQIVKRLDPEPVVPDFDSLHRTIAAQRKEAGE
jgi:Fe-S-cluster-containing hydrogenase component 2